MLIDSHCHLNMLDLQGFDNDLQQVLQQAKEQDVQKLLTVCVTLSDLSEIEAIALQYNNIYTSVGVHPNEEVEKEPTMAELAHLAMFPACIAIGETGLDYYRTVEEEAKEHQRQRFRTHIQAAHATQKPLIIHTRQASEDTLKIMAEENAQAIGGVMHCFSENWEVAQRALDLNFYISFSGILTFKSAIDLQNIAQKVPLDRILIETDSPYLAPVPYRGRPNHPAWVKEVAKKLAELRGEDFETIAKHTTDNFFRCFRVAA